MDPSVTITPLNFRFPFSPIFTKTNFDNFFLKIRINKILPLKYCSAVSQSQHYFFSPFPTYHRNIEAIFRKYSIEILQYCKNIYKAVRKVSEILQEPRNVRSKHYKWNVAAILIFYCNTAVMWELSSSFVCFFLNKLYRNKYCTSKYPMQKYREYLIINDIRKKTLLRNFIFSLYFLLSLGFELTYLQKEGLWVNF